MRKYWFVLYPDTFLWVKDNIGLLYNVKSNAKIKFINEGKLAEITRELLYIDNLYRIVLTEEELEHNEINTWVHKIVDSDCGYLIMDDGTNKRPLSLPPILKVQDGIEYYKWEHKQNIDGNVIQNLHQLIFHINGSESGNNLYSRQILYPVKSELILDAEKINWFVMNAKYSSFLSEISLVGNPFNYPDLVEMINKLQNICTVTVQVAIQDIVRYLSQAKELFAITNLNLLVTDYVMLEQLSDISTWAKDISYTFIVTSKEEYKYAFAYTEGHDLKNSNIVPVYTKANLSFFENDLFMDEEELHNLVLSKKEVFIRQTLNVFNFGKLYVMPDGNVYSNLNRTPIGNIKEPPHDIVYREITEGDSWLCIRDQQPCCDCVYQWLCPSPSNYEQVIDRVNLCDIR